MRWVRRQIDTASLAIGATAKLELWLRAGAPALQASQPFAKAPGAVVDHPVTIVVFAVAHFGLWGGVGTGRGMVFCGCFEARCIFSLCSDLDRMALSAPSAGLLETMQPILAVSILGARGADVAADHNRFGAGDPQPQHGKP